MSYAGRILSLIGPTMRDWLTKNGQTKDNPVWRFGQGRNTPQWKKKKQDPVPHWGKEANDDDDDTRLILFSYCIMFICETRRIQLEIVSHNFNTVEL